jgi:Glycosyl transferases group 1
MVRCYTPVVMLAGAIPYAKDMGLSIAIMSDIDALRANGIKTTLLAYDLGRSPADRLPPSRECVVIPAKAGGRLTRFLRAIPTSLPGAAERYYSEEARAIIRGSVQQIRPAMIVIQSPTLAAWIPMLRELVPDAIIVARSDNVIADIARKQVTAAPLSLKPFYALESVRWQSLERLLVQASDRVWAITDTDKVLLQEIYGRTDIDCLPVAVSVEKYSKIEIRKGDDTTFILIGSLDLKKAHGVRVFLRDIWPILKGIKPELRLVVSGRIATRYSIDTDGVEYIGYVDDDAALYAEGRFALNPQILGGGIKLKSLHSMAAGRTLVATNNGVQGMNVEHGTHYWNLETLSASNALNSLFESTRLNLEIARAGREWVSEHHSHSRVADIAGSLLAEALGKPGRRAALGRVDGSRPARRR